jgi:uncharacterized cupin superfamily protein
MALRTLQPGWRWSTNVGFASGAKWCEAEHFQYIVSGTFAVRSREGDEYTARAGEVIYVAPGHDGWVAGDEPVVTVSFGGDTGFWDVPA